MCIRDDSHRGSTLVYFPIAGKTSHTTVTESPGRIRATQSWFSAASCKDASSTRKSKTLTPAGISLCCIATAYSSRLRILTIQVFEYPYLPQQRLYFLPLPHGHGSLRPGFLPTITVPDFFCSKYSRFFVSSS